MARATIIMLVVFFALAGGAFALERTNPAKPADAQVYVLDVKDTDVQRLDVQTAAGQQSFDRADPFGWKFANSDEAADLSRVSSVINRLAKLRSSAKVADNPGDLSPYGLTPPVDTATLVMKDGTTYRILVGTKTVNDAAYYAMVEGAPTLHTINTLLVGDLEKLVTDPPHPTPTPDPSAVAIPSPTLSGTPVQPVGTPEPAPTIGLPAPSTE
jgi:hypothetical protein